ncbi:hypothetical protein MIMGU_mgv1a016240mg [Erythranthe guttata]|uniref:Light-regulated protein n=1 Tax=Erythranthe guttata TaxID=4155 RepID=A0A022QX02_ERYGU|nr:hypothetical protein MIMGU_mgv1a016240mg [Erythranthe guttata]
MKILALSLSLSHTHMHTHTHTLFVQCSVFPAEACETVGGEACLADIGPEVKLEPAQPNIPKKTASEPIDREYLDYTQDSRTVLLGEACEVLGGDFCEPPYPK